jgi:uncharacterized protein YegL
MPRLNDAVMEERALPNTHFGYSATRIAELGATEYTLVDLVVDVSGSVAACAADEEVAIREVVNACKMSPRADNLMLRVVLFNGQLQEFHGYKLLANCNLADYQGFLRCGGNTALFDAAENAVLAQVHYAGDLAKNDYSVNSLVVIITDGCDNASAVRPAQVRAALESAVKSEATESMVSILIGVGTAFAPAVSSELAAFKNEAGISQYVETKDASARTLAKLAAFVSKSISAVSKSLGSGQASQLLTPPADLSI